MTIETIDKGYSVETYLDGELHSEDGKPAVEWRGGAVEYYDRGKRHRINGPALHSVIPPYSRWFINGYEVTEEIEEWAKGVDLDLNNLNKEDEVMIAIVWGNYAGK